jgi:site-specific DNA-methyltransferase (adenine-specific)
VIAINLAHLNMANTLYYGDNLDVLRESIKAESVDLIYLDPPFNSKREYNLLFKSPKGQKSDAQITAFEDSWHWGPQAEREFDEVLHQSNTDMAEMVKALRSFLGENDMMAYLTMMANRLLELRRVLKPSGSLYLHCDPTASHYLKMVLDGVFGKESFVNEIVWKRTSAHSDAKRFASVHDILFFYADSAIHTWNQQYEPYTEEYIKTHFVHLDSDGRVFRRVDLRSPNPRPNLTYDYTASNGIIYKPHRNGWAVSRDKMEQLDREGRLFFPKKNDARLRRKLYLEDSPGVAVSDNWTDIKPIFSVAAERLGFPTQKPLELLERIISASSNEGDIVLDPFCGCGTAVHAAEKLNRRWIGIDITHLAISLIEKRLKDAFGRGCRFEVHGTPKDLDSARDLADRDKYQFQWWAVSLVEAQPYQGKKKGADTGIDGLKFFNDIEGDAKKIVVSVKGGAALKPDDIRAINFVRERESAEIALLISLAEPTTKMKSEAAAAGIYSGGPDGKLKYARLQLLTIEGLLSGKQRAEHPEYVPNLTFKKAKREKRDRQKTLDEQDE